MPIRSTSLIVGPTRPAHSAQHRTRWLVVAVVAILAIALWLLASCRPEVDKTDLVILDRTGIALSPEWATEVASQTGIIVDDALDHDVNELVIVSMGTNAQDAAKIATVKLDVGGNTDVKRAEARTALKKKVAAVVAEVASRPVSGNGTDVAASFDTAAGICGSAAECRIWAFSDLEDQRVTQAPSDAAARRAIASSLPDLGDIPVTVAGIGASGSPTTTVERVTTVWPVLFQDAGATSVRLVRSL